MSLSSTELSFVEKREKLTKYWPPFGIGILLLLSALAIWLWAKVPHLINPWAVSSSLQAGTLAESTMGFMAAILPIVMLTLLVFSVIVVLFMFMAFSSERRLIRLVRRLDSICNPQMHPSNLPLTSSKALNPARTGAAEP